MRDATRNIRPEFQERAGGDGFVILAVVCAAVLVAMFALHGGPNLLGDAFDPSALLARGQ